MNDHLRERINRKLDALPDERGYQILDFIEFLESKYAERQNAGNAFTRFTEAVEDKMRAGKVSAAAIAETMSLLNRAANVLNGAVAAGKSVASDLYSAAQNVGAPPRPSGQAGQSGTSSATPPGQSSPPGQPTPPPSSPPPDASSPAHDVKQPGSGEERL